MTTDRAIQREATTILDTIARAASDPAVDVSKLERLLAIQQTWMADQRRTAFMGALARLQEKMPQIGKSGTIVDNYGKVRNKFAKLEDVDRVIRPLCAEEGFCFYFNSTPKARGIEYSCTMAHRDGHSETATLELPVDAGAGRNAVQSVGSTTSYARRYLMGMHLNIVTREEDNDGNDVEPKNGKPSTYTRVDGRATTIEPNGDLADGHPPGHVERQDATDYLARIEAAAGDSALLEQLGQTIKGLTAGFTLDEMADLRKAMKAAKKMRKPSEGDPGSLEVGADPGGLGPTIPAPPVTAADVRAAQRTRMERGGAQGTANMREPGED